MIIRSQGKKTIVDFSAGCVLEAMQGDDWIGVAFINNDESIDMGFYDSMGDAIAVVDCIFNAIGRSGKYNMPQKDQIKAVMPVAEDNGTETPISVLYDNYDLSVRGYNCMKRAGGDYAIIEKVEQMDDEQLMKVRNLGRWSMEDLKRAIRDWRADQ